MGEPCEVCGGISEHDWKIHADIGAARVVELEAGNKRLARERELYLGLWHQAEAEMAEMREATDG